MASISSLSSSSSSSIYGSRNVNILSGLASGLDTESMIEGLVESYQMKISGLEQDRTVVQWQQNAIQEISNMLVDFSEKYTSFTSSTNLSSAAFFTSSSITTALGQFADKISATGKSSSDILINSVAQLATSTKYTRSAQDLLSSTGVTASGGKTTVSGDAPTIDYGGTMNVSDLEGSLTLGYGAKSVTIRFDELEFIDSANNGTGTITADDLKTAIENKLSEVDITFDNGNTMKASEAISIDVSGATLSFSDKTGAGNGVTIKSASGDLQTTLGLTEIAEDQSSFMFTPGTHSSSVNTMEYLNGKTIDVNYNSASLSIKIDDTWTSANFESKINEALAKEYGAGKVSASIGSDGTLSFETSSTSTLTVSSSVGEALGFGSDNMLSSYLHTSTTLADMGFTGEQNLVINGVDLGTFSEDTSLSTIISNINNNDEAGVNVSYSQLTNSFTFTSDKTGAGSQISFGGSLGTALFGDTSDPASGTYTEGTDAVISASINGEQMTLTRSSNTFEIDGMTFIAEGTFNQGSYTGPIVNGMDESGNVLTNEQMFGTGEAVSFSTQTDSDKIIDAVKDMVEDYNEIMETVKQTYSDRPLTQSDGSDYDPLTSEDKADLTESEIAAYEEKAKTGILFMDNDLSGLFAGMRDAITSIGGSNAELAEIGITAAYDDGVTTLVLDETKLRTALDTDVEKVQQVFTANEDYGSSSNGIMANLDSVLDRYAKTTGEPKGILIQLAGSAHSPSSLLQNTMLDKMDDIEEDITMWTDKLADQVDYYTAQFTRLEVLINEMNSQSSALSGLMGS